MWRAPHKRFRKPSVVSRPILGVANSDDLLKALHSAPWLSLAVIGPLGERQRTKANLGGHVRTTTDGFEDRGSGELAS